MMTRRISAWAGPVIGIAAVLCAAIATTYASGTRVAISIPVAANIGGTTAIGGGAASPVPLNASTLTLVHPTHPVEVLDGADSSVEANEPSRSDDPATPTRTTSPRATVTAESDDVTPSHAAPSKTPVPSVAPAPSATPAPPTGTWSEDDPTRSPRPTSSGWTPTAKPSPSTSHSHGDDSENDRTGGASQPGS